MARRGAAAPREAVRQCRSSVTLDAEAPMRAVRGPPRSAVRRGCPGRRRPRRETTGTTGVPPGWRTGAGRTRSRPADPGPHSCQAVTTVVAAPSSTAASCVGRDGLGAARGAEAQPGDDAEGAVAGAARRPEQVGARWRSRSAVGRRPSAVGGDDRGPGEAVAGQAVGGGDDSVASLRSYAARQWPCRPSSRAARGLTAATGGVHPSFTSGHRRLHLFCLLSAVPGADACMSVHRRPQSSHAAEQDGG